MVSYIRILNRYSFIPHQAEAMINLWKVTIECRISATSQILWVGASDRRLHLFENMFPIPDGVAYNSYVILDEKTAIMDTADSSVTRQYLENLTAALGGRQPDYLVVNHMEPDHCADIAELARLYPSMQIVGNQKTFGLMNQFYNMDLEGRTVVVKEGDVLDLGEHKLTFVMAPMVHWPEAMMSYESTHKILFSADAFGSFGALDGAVFNDENLDPHGLHSELRRYYSNIVGKYGMQVQAVLKKAAGLEISMICPLHGPVLKENLGYYIGLYDTWSSYKPEDKGVLVAYASIHGNTAKAAQKFAEMLRAKGVEKVSVMDLSRDDMAEVVEDAFRYDRMVLAAASYDGGVFPCMQDFLNHLQSKAFQNRTVGIIENGTWGPTAGRTMKGILETMKNITIVEPMVTIRSAMKESDLPAMEALADVIANA